MKRPLLWNNLDEAAEWLTDSTGEPWTTRDVLNAPLIIDNPHYAGYNPAFSNNKFNPYRRSLRTALMAAMPRDTVFARYEFIVGKGLVRKEVVRWGMVRLYPPQVAEILAGGATATVFGPGEDLEHDIYIFIEPLNQEHTVTSDMVRIKGRDLFQLSAAFGWMDAQSLSAPPGINVENKPHVLMEKKESNKYRPSIVHSKPNRDVVDPVIDEAIDRAGSMESAAVYLSFRDLVLEERGPFNGKMVGSVFFYTNSENELVPFTKDALFRRLNRRARK